MGVVSVGRVVLASASPRRRELLALICPEFEVIPSGFDEAGMPPDLVPEDHVVQSAMHKARDVAARAGDAIVIGADTVVTLDEHILGKPAGARDAARMLRLLSGRTHQVCTGLHVIDTRFSQRRELNGCEHTDVRFRELTERMVELYVATGEPLDKAGAYAIQGRGAALIKGISGCFFNVVGLPIYRLSLILEELGMEVFACK